MCLPCPPFPTPQRLLSSCIKNSNTPLGFRINEPNFYTEIYLPICIYIYHLHTCIFRRLRLISAALYTSRYVTGSYLSACECSHQTHVGQHGHSQTTTREVSFALLLVVTQSTPHRECSTTPK